MLILVFARVRALTFKRKLISTIICKSVSSVYTNSFIVSNLIHYEFGDNSLWKDGKKYFFLDTAIFHNSSSYDFVRKINHAAFAIIILNLSFPLVNRSSNNISKLSTLISLQKRKRIVATRPLISHYLGMDRWRFYHSFEVYQ